MASELTWTSYLLNRGIGLALCAPVASVLFSMILLNQKKGLERSGAAAAAAAASPLAAVGLGSGAEGRRQLGSKGSEPGMNSASGSGGGGSGGRGSTESHSPSSAAHGATLPSDSYPAQRPFASFGLSLSILEPAFRTLDGWMDWAAERVSSAIIVVVICLPIGGISMLRVWMSRFGHKVGVDHVWNLPEILSHSHPFRCPDTTILNHPTQLFIGDDSRFSPEDVVLSSLAFFLLGRCESYYFFLSTLLICSFIEGCS